MPQIRLKLLRQLWLAAGWGSAMMTFSLFAGGGLGLGALTDFDVIAQIMRALAMPTAASAFLLCIGIGAFRHGILDPRLAIRRTTVYGALGVLFIVLFAVVESLISELLEARLGLPTMLGAALAGATVALIVIPLRGRFSRWMDRWMPAPAKAAGDVQTSDVA